MRILLLSALALGLTAGCEGLNFPTMASVQEMAQEEADRDVTLQALTVGQLADMACVTTPEKCEEYQALAASNTAAGRQILERSATLIGGQKGSLDLLWDNPLVAGGLGLLTAILAWFGIDLRGAKRKLNEPSRLVQSITAALTPNPEKAVVEAITESVKKGTTG